jgi:oleate hydratase
LGTGVASLAAAVYLIREAKVAPSKIHILEALSEACADLASKWNEESGYHYRAGCIPPLCDGHVEELLALVPSATPGKSVWNDIQEHFVNHVGKQSSRTRCMAWRKDRLVRLEGRKHQLCIKERMDLFLLSSKSESALGRSRIQEHFSATFFKTNYWLTLATLYVAIRSKGIENY